MGARILTMVFFDESGCGSCEACSNTPTDVPLDRSKAATTTKLTGIERHGG
jgi:hypothetical protein